jgi:amino acid transporter
MEARKRGLSRELKLRDLVLTQVVMIVGLPWLGFAAKQGATQLLVWLLALALFYLPLAAVVMKLSRAIPLEGGSYQRVKEVGSTLANGFAYLGAFVLRWDTRQFIYPLQEQ